MSIDDRRDVVRHVQNANNTSSKRRPRSRGDILFVSGARLAQVHMSVDHAG